MPPDTPPSRPSPLAVIAGLLIVLLLLAVAFAGFLVAPLAILALFYVGFAVADRAAAPGPVSGARSELAPVALAPVPDETAEERRAREAPARRRPI